eukprot:6178138-Pleurochrysis_carterae.AAC.2
MPPGSVKLVPLLAVIYIPMSATSCNNSRVFLSSQDEQAAQLMDDFKENEDYEEELEDQI